MYKNIYLKKSVYPDPPCRVELSFFAVSFNLCSCLKSSSITVDIWQEVNKITEENQKVLLSSQITI